MTRSAFRLMHAAALATIATGTVYGWMCYLCKPDDIYAVVNHPWQPHVQHLHVLFAPALAVMLGVFWVPHALRYWRLRKREGRRSGTLLWWLALPMIFSGYMLQIVSHESLKLAIVWLHVTSGCLWAIAFGAHFMSHRRRRS